MTMKSDRERYMSAIAAVNDRRQGRNPPAGHGRGPIPLLPQSPRQREMPRER